MLKSIFLIGAIILLLGNKRNRTTTEDRKGLLQPILAASESVPAGQQPHQGPPLTSHLKDLTPPSQAILVRAARFGKASAARSDNIRN